MSSIIDLYANTPIGWRRVTGHGPTGNPLAVQTTINTLWDEARRLVRNGAGELVNSDARALTAAAVKVGDELVDPSGRVWLIGHVTIHRDLLGAELYREAVL